MIERNKWAWHFGLAEGEFAFDEFAVDAHA
jgi:hypothetical protein